MNGEREARQRTPKRTPAISWESDIALLTNWRVLVGVAKMSALAPLIVVGLLAIPLGAQGEWRAIGDFAGLGLAFMGVLLVISLVVLTVMTGNRYRLKFRLDDEGASVGVADPRARAIHRGALVAGILGRSVTTAGTGALAMASESQTAPWRRVVDVRYDTRANVIDLRGSWRSLAVLYCPPERYEEIAATVAQRVAESKKSGRGRAGPSLTSLLAWSAMAIIACLPLFGLPYPFRINLFMPIFLIGFGVACVWFIPPLGWPLLGGAILTAIDILFIGFSNRAPASLGEGSRRSGFSSLIGDEWLLLIFAGLGLAYLMWFAIHTIRGRGPSALYRDMY
ncbi:MAG: hypothetical protein KDJ25_01075 [Rhodoblastus sp.]|nr:hypothetical protein [Rhodoblastus sp.]